MNKRTGLIAAAGAAIFLGSALLFNVQPMTGRLLLPLFGGGATVWTACLVAFQLLLLAGYAYAAGVTRLRPALQAPVHLALLAAAAFWPGAVRLAEKGLEESELPPVLRVLFIVLAGTGPAYLLLSAGTTLLQSWLARAHPGWNVYRLYAVSNAGSFVGLFAYPLLFELLLPLPVQQGLWRGLFIAYGLLLALLALLLRPSGSLRPPAVVDPAPESGGNGSPFLHRWWGLPLLSSFLLTAATASLTQDITPMPMVWSLLLGAFLLGYVAGFTRTGERLTSLWALLALCFMAGYGLIRMKGWGGLTLVLFMGAGVVLFGSLFLCALLYASRPPARRLPAYYLAIAAGGAAGGLLAGLLAPLLFRGVYEYGVAAVALAGLAVFHLVRNRLKMDAVELGLAGLAALAAVVMEPVIHGSQAAQSIWRSRNFYGVLRVNDAEMASKYGDRLGRARSLVHGSTTHGFQALTPALRDRPTQYYGPQGGGYPIRVQALRKEGRPLRVGVVGLGVGTLAVFGREGDLFRFYEIDPQVVRAASDTNLFTYLAESPAKVEVAMGDARLTLDREREAGEPPLDVLVVDAFTGDSVPMHLLTREAVALFLDRVGEKGLLAFHISNRYIDLLPPLKAAAAEAGVRFFAWQNQPSRDAFEAPSRWVLMARSGPAFETEGAMTVIAPEAIPPFRVLTDDAGSILPLVDWTQKRIVKYMEGKPGHRPPVGR